jgi:phage baseplate assembly protein V
MAASDVRKIVEAMTAPLKRSMRLMLSTGTVSLTDAEREIQVAQVKGLGGEVMDDVQYFQHWGFTSRPLKGASGLLGTLLGSRGRTVLLGSADARWRPKDLAEGESCLFDDKGQRIYLRRDRIELISPMQVVVTTPSVTIDAAQSTFKGDVQVDGNFHADGTVLSDTQVSVGNIHLTGHRHSNVQNGAGTSGEAVP